MSSNERNPQRLYKNLETKKIAGVCAGIADYFSINVFWVRVLVVISAVNFGTTIIIYIVLAMMLDPRPDDLYATPVEERFWKTFRHAPGEMVDTLEARFERISKRLQDMEAVVTSERFRLQSEFDKLS